LAERHLWYAFIAIDDFEEHAGGGAAGDGDIAGRATLHDAGVGFEIQARAHFAGAVAGETAAGEEWSNVIIVVGAMRGLGERNGGKREEKSRVHNQWLNSNSVELTKAQRTSS
jgi:hypothetical protein